MQVFFGIMVTHQLFYVRLIWLMASQHYLVEQM